MKTLSCYNKLSLGKSCFNPLIRSLTNSDSIPSTLVSKSFDSTPDLLTPNQSHFKPTIFNFGYSVLSSVDIDQKCIKTQEAFDWIQSQDLSNLSPQKCNLLIGQSIHPVPIPEIANFPKLIQPKDMPSHQQLGLSLTDYLLHGLAHIEMNAIHAAWDTILRFSNHSHSIENSTSPSILPFEFYLDFLLIAADEARHFRLLNDRLKYRNMFYGMIPAHSGIWDVVERTKDDLKGRLAVIQLVQEPRALDSWDRLVMKFKSQNDLKTSNLIDCICREEIRHVKIGIQWFQWMCEREKIDPISTFHQLALQYTGLIPPPFNKIARIQAGMSEDWYLPVSRIKVLRKR